MLKGKVFDVQRSCVHDGPGLRTTFFMAGCPLSCSWCHNPEGLKARAILTFNAEACIGCKLCETNCNNNVHSIDDNNFSHNIDRTGCISCSNCIKVCPSNALTMSCYEITVDDVIRIAKQDQMFYRQNGGVTFSGGECTVYADFVYECLKELSKENINCCIDSCGYADFSVFEKLAPLTQVFLYDIKGFDTNTHKKHTGVHNELITQNLIKLDKIHNDIWIRIPIIPDVNDSKVEMEGIAQLLSKLSNINKITLMPYHKLGSNKYDNLGLEYGYDKEKSVDSDRLNEFINIFKSYNLNVEN